MRNPYKSVHLGAVVAGLLVSGIANPQQDSLPPPLPREPIGVIETLPRVYPEHWFLVHDDAFFHMSDGKVYVIDAAADTLHDQVKGSFNVALLGNIAQSSARGEIYALETFYSRGTRGDRLDVLTIWDSETLSPSGEVILPGNKRLLALPQLHALQVIGDDLWLAVANFNPVTSVTIIDLDNRKIVSDIPTPGCILIYPTGKRGFSSLCADGRFLSTELTRDGQIAKQTRTDAFFDSENVPIFEDAAIVDNTAYFPTFAGLVYPVEMRGKVAKAGNPWNLVPAAERAGDWAPGGLSIIDRDDLGRLYVLMHAGAKDGTHNGGGSEVWVFDPRKQERIMRIPLQEWGLSVALSRGKRPLLMVTNPITMALEIYDATSGEYLRTITGFGQETPFIMHGAR